jgi:hypothetical protein
MASLKDEDPKLGTCYSSKGCREAMRDKGKVSKQKCKEFGGKSWKSQVTGQCDELQPHEPESSE